MRNAEIHRRVAPRSGATQASSSKLRLGSIDGCFETAIHRTQHSWNGRRRWPCSMLAGRLPREPNTAGQAYADLEPVLLAGSMKRSQLEALLRELACVLGKREVTMIGSQCVHAATDTPPAEVLMSRECDILVENSDPARAQIFAERGQTRDQIPFACRALNEKKYTCVRWMPNG